MNSLVLRTIPDEIKKSTLITIDDGAVDYFCRNNPIYREINWLEFSPFDFRKLNVEDRLNFVFVLNSISFCYWQLPKWKIEYNGNVLDGAWAMIGSIHKAHNRGVPILSFTYLKKLTLKDLKEILHGENELSQLPERVKILNELGSVMEKKYNGQVLSFIEQNDYSTEKLLSSLVKDFSFFQDSIKYKKSEINFHKKAQLTVSDLNYCLNVISNRTLTNVETLTACADYKIPFVLREYSILTYSNELLKILQNSIELDRGSEEEITLRCFAILGVEALKTRYNQLYKKQYYSNEVNDFLWLIGQIKHPRQINYHKCFNEFY